MPKKTPKNPNKQKALAEFGAGPEFDSLAPGSHTTCFQHCVSAPRQQTRNTEFQDFQATHNSSPSRCKARLASESCEQIRTGADGVSGKVQEEHCQVLGVFSWGCVFRSPNDGLHCYDAAGLMRNVPLFSPKFDVVTGRCRCL